MQDKKWSLIESTVNTIVGYLLSMLTRSLVFPLFGFDVSLRDNFIISFIFFIVSFVKNYAMRRVFNNVKKSKEVLKDESNTTII